jgi:hypothetical protein
LSVTSDSSKLWRAARLRYKLHSGQRAIYDHYREWEKRTFEARKRGEPQPSNWYWPRIYAMNCGRRFGKDFMSLLIRLEDGLRNPGSTYTYATAYAKDIASIILPLFDQIVADCPESIKPIYKQSYQGTEAGLFFANGSIIRLVGIDTNPNGLRGRASHGFTISEACFCDKLKYVVTSVIMPQFMGHLGATLMMNSTPSDEPAHSWKVDFVPDAITRGAYQHKTIFDNPRIGEAERNEFIATLGGIDSEQAKRELLCIDVRSESRTVIPEFNAAIHVMEWEQPEYCLGYTAIDPGSRDLCAVVCAYYDFSAAKLIVVSDWAKRNASTAEIAAAVRKCEEQAFGESWYWDHDKFKPNPFLRLSDTEPRLIHDLNVQHDLKVGSADKTDGKEAGLNNLRNAFHQHRIIVAPTAQNSILHLEGAIWNQQRTDYVRSEVLGHCDIVDALKYMWRGVNQQMSPFPPYGVILNKTVPKSEMHSLPEHFKTERGLIQTAKKLLGGRSFVARRFGPK